MKFALTPTERLELAGQFLHKELQISGLTDTKRFNRLRLALRVGDLMDKIANRKSFATKPLKDNARAAFTLEKDQIDFLIEKICVLPMNGAQAALIGDFYLALENAKLGITSPETEVPDFDPGSECWDVKDDQEDDESKE